MSPRDEFHAEIASLVDADEISDLVNEAYRAIGGPRGWTHEADLISGGRVTSGDVAGMIGDPALTVLVRRRGGSPVPVACVAVELSQANEGLISMLAIAPALQAAGLGRAMLANAERFAKGKGATVAKMTVIEQRDQLIAWYERRGYRRTGAYETFPYGDDSVGVPLRGDLRFVVLEKIL